MSDQGTGGASGSSAGHPAADQSTLIDTSASQSMEAADRKLAAHKSSVPDEGDLVLGAGNAGGSASNLQAKAITRLWNKTAFPFSTDPAAHGEITQNNLIDIRPGAEALDAPVSPADHVLQISRRKALSVAAQVDALVFLEFADNPIDQ